MRLGKVYRFVISEMRYIWNVPQGGSYKMTQKAIDEFDEFTEREMSAAIVIGWLLMFGVPLIMAFCLLWVGWNLIYHLLTMKLI